MFKASIVEVAGRSYGQNVVGVCQVPGQIWGKPRPYPLQSKAVEKLLGGKAPGVDEIYPERLKALNIVGLSWLTRSFNVAWRSGTVPVE